MALTQVNTDGVKDDAVTLAKQAAGTDGQVITYDASGNPTAVGPGTDGQVLTSTGAGSPPAFENVPAGGAALTGSTNNTITTVTGANAIQGEANLTYDGTNLTLTTDADGEGIIVSNSGNTYNQFTFDADRSSAGIPVGAIFAKWDGNTIGSVQWNAGTDTTNKDDGYFDLRTAEGGTNTERVRVHQGGDVEVKTGNVVVGTAGKGIDFSAQTSSSSSGASATGEVLTHYEFGTWTPVVKLGTTVNSGTVSGAVYTRIGNLVTVQCTVTSITESGTGNLSVHGMPFDRAHGDPTGFCRWAGISTNGTAWPYIASTTVEFQNGGDDGYVGSLTNSNTSATYNLYSLQLVYHC